MKLRSRTALTACLLVSTAGLAAPTTASACPSLAHVTAFRGHVTELTFTGQATGSDGNGGTASITLDRNATAIPINLTHHAHGPLGTVFTGSPPRGGAISVDDTFTDPTQMLSGTQTASGPTGLTTGPELVLLAGSCKYQLSASFGIGTTSSGNWPTSGPDTSAGGAATSPEKKIPKGLKLSGTATLPAYATCPAGVNPNGCYVFEGLSWTQEYDTLSGAPSDQPEGSATFGWSISPVLAKHKHKPPKRTHH